MNHVLEKYSQELKRLVQSRSPNFQRHVILTMAACAGVGVAAFWVREDFPRIAYWVLFATLLTYALFPEKRK